MIFTAPQIFLSLILFTVSANALVFPRATVGDICAVQCQGFFATANCAANDTACVCKGILSDSIATCSSCLVDALSGGNTNPHFTDYTNTVASCQNPSSSSSSSSVAPAPTPNPAPAPTSSQAPAPAPTTSSKAAGGMRSVAVPAGAALGGAFVLALLM